MTKPIDFTAKLVRNPIKPKSDNWQETAHEWRVTINGQTFEYFTGRAHREFAKNHGLRLSLSFNDAKHEYNRLRNANLTSSELETLLSLSKPVTPTLDAVLHALVMDADASEQGFEDWAQNLGYDPDSRKALATYLACQENTMKLRKAGIDIAAERERLADY